MPQFPAVRSLTSRVVAAPLALVVAALLAGCVPNVFPQFRGVTFEGVQADVVAADLELRLGLRWRFPNPLETDLTVPAHAFRLLVTTPAGDELVVPGTASQQAEFTIPAGGSRDVVYPLVLDLAPASELAELDLLGRDVPYAFQADIVIDLPGPFVPDQTLPLRFEDSLRLPLLPVLTLQPGETPSATLIGDIRYYDVGDAVEPVVDGMDDFVQVLFQVGDVLLGLPPFTAAAALLGIDLPSAWTGFQEQWTALGEVDVEIPDLSQSTIEGVRLSLPLALTNPNRFPVAAPSLESALTVAGAGSVVALGAAWPAGGEIPALTTVPFVVTNELRWSAAGLGVLDLVAGESVTVALTGEAEVDLGYGLVRVPVQLASVTLELGAE